jgi:hypothetical protein
MICAFGLWAGYCRHWVENRCDWIVNGKYEIMGGNGRERGLMIEIGRELGCKGVNGLILLIFHQIY